MTRERWQQIEALFLAALEREASERAAFLTHACGADAELRREVEGMLAADAETLNLIDAPAYEAAADLLRADSRSMAVGQFINHYKVSRELGRGGMGEVYLADDTRLGRPVAIKLLPTSFIHDADRVRRFQQEARAASALNHPNIVTIYEVGEFETLRFIVSEFVEGKTLRELLKADGLELEQALDIIIQTAGALSAAHQAGIIHRDIKPENIMVRSDGYVKVLDFGLAKLTGRAPGAVSGAPGEAAAKFSEMSTQPGMVMGTVKYMSPEQARGQKVDPRTDIFSLGVLFYEMITGRAPFEGETPSHIIVAILEHEPPPISDYVPDAPAELQAVIAKALRKGRDARYAQISEMLSALQELRQELQIQARQGRVVASGASGAGSKYGASVARLPRPDEASSAPQSEPLIQRKAASAEPMARRLKRHRLAVACALILVITGTVTWIYSYTANRTDSLAVLPFTYSNLSLGGATDVDAEYLCDGMTETLISNLSQMPRLKVIARSSVVRFKGKEIDPQELGRLLDVRTILTGRIIQRGDQLAVSAELVDARNNSRLWGNQYDIKMADLQPTQREIARAISEQLGIRLTGEQQQQIDRRGTDNSGAYELYIKGRYFWNKRTAEDIKKGIEYYQQAIAKDPNFGLAYAGLAESYAVLPRYTNASIAEVTSAAREAVSKALAIDEHLAEAHASLALLCSQELNWSMALSEFQRAIELNPNYATAHHWKGQTLSQLGRFDEAVAEAEKAREQDPISGSINSSLGSVLYYSRRYDRAIEQYKKALELYPDVSGHHIHLGRAYAQNGMPAEAIIEFQKAEALANERGRLPLEFACAYALSGNRAEALKYLQEIQNAPPLATREPYAMAKVFAALGDKDQAFVALNKSFEIGEADLGWIKVDPQLDNLHNDPRFAELLKRVHLSP